MSVSLRLFGWERTTDSEETVREPTGAVLTKRPREVHHECRHCGRNLPPGTAHCGNCGGTAVAYDVG
jgi:uncharacterized OB-fold protein